MGFDPPSFRMKKLKNEPLTIDLLSECIRVHHKEFGERMTLRQADKVIRLLNKILKVYCKVSRTCGGTADAPSSNLGGKP